MVMHPVSVLNIVSADDKTKLLARNRVFGGEFGIASILIFLQA